MVAGLGATVLALTAVGRPLLAMLRSTEANSDASRALTNEQLVLALCGLGVLYFGIAPIVSVGDVASSLFDWMDAALGALRE